MKSLETAANDYAGDHNSSNDLYHGFIAGANYQKVLDKAKVEKVIKYIENNATMWEECYITAKELTDLINQLKEL